MFLKVIYIYIYELLSDMNADHHCVSRGNPGESSKVETDKCVWSEDRASGISKQKTEIEGSTGYSL